MSKPKMSRGMDGRSRFSPTFRLSRLSGFPGTLPLNKSRDRRRRCYRSNVPITGVDARSKTPTAALTAKSMVIIPLQNSNSTSALANTTNAGQRGLKADRVPRGLPLREREPEKLQTTLLIWPGTVVPHLYPMTMGKPRRYTDDQLRQVIPAVKSIAQLLAGLGLRPAGGNYWTVQRRIKELGLDVSHFRGQGWSRGLSFQRRNPIPLEEILVDGSTYKSHALKKRLIEAGLKAAKCEECGLEFWRGHPTPLELDHLNGKRDDNRLANLRIVCPNCHALTSTYRGKNKRRSQPP